MFVLILFMHYFVFTLVLQSSCKGRESCSLCYYCLTDVLLLFTFCGSSSLRELSGRVFDSRSRGCGFEPRQRHCVVSLNETH